MEGLAHNDIDWTLPKVPPFKQYSCQFAILHLKSFFRIKEKREWVVSGAGWSKACGHTWAGHQAPALWAEGPSAVGSSCLGPLSLPVEKCRLHQSHGDKETKKETEGQLRQSLARQAARHIKKYWNQRGRGRVNQGKDRQTDTHTHRGSVCKLDTPSHLNITQYFK